MDEANTTTHKFTNSVVDHLDHTVDERGLNTSVLPIALKESTCMLFNWGRSIWTPGKTE